jgi:hypothetical protein
MSYRVRHAEWLANDVVVVPASESSLGPCLMLGCGVECATSTLHVQMPTAARATSRFSAKLAAISSLKLLQIESSHVCRFIQYSNHAMLINLIRHPWYIPDSATGFAFDVDLHLTQGCTNETRQSLCF